MKIFTGICLFILLLFLLAIFGLPPTQAQYSTAIYRAQDGNQMVVGAAGELIIDGSFFIEDRKLVLVKYAADPNATSATVTVPGLDSSDLILATVNTNTGGAYIKDVSPYANEAIIHFSSDPGTSIKVSLMAWED